MLFRMDAGCNIFANVTAVASYIMQHNYQNSLIIEQFYPRRVKGIKTNLQRRLFFFLPLEGKFWIFWKMLFPPKRQDLFEVLEERSPLI